MVTKTQKQLEKMTKDGRFEIYATIGSYVQGYRISDSGKRSKAMFTYQIEG